MPSCLRIDRHSQTCKPEFVQQVAELSPQSRSNTIWALTKTSAASQVAKHHSSMFFLPTIQQTLLAAVQTCCSWLPVKGLRGGALAYQLSEQIGLQTVLSVVQLHLPPPKPETSETPSPNRQVPCLSSTLLCVQDLLPHNSTEYHTARLTWFAPYRVRKLSEVSYLGLPGFG